MKIDNQNDLIEDLKSVDVFKNLQQSTLQVIANNVSCIKLNRGETLFKKGDDADAMFVVKSGALAVSIVNEDGKEAEVGDINRGGIVGEIQFITGGKRIATLCAKEETELIKIHKTIFDNIQDDLASFVKQLNKIIRDRLLHNRLVQILPKLFGSLTSYEILAIAKNAESVSIQRGNKLFCQDETADSFYILLNGILGVSIKDKTGKEAVVNYVNSGESVGEISLITDDVRTATVFAMRNSELVKFSKPIFLSFLKMYPNLSLQIMQMIVSRLLRVRHKTKRGKKCTVIAIVPISPEAPTDEFTNRLIKNFSAQDSILHINSKDLDKFLETPEISQIPKNSPHMIRVETWFNLQEEKYSYIVFEADKSTSNWTKQCLSRAEHVVVVGNAASDPGLSEIELELLYNKEDAQLVRYTLILLHPNGINQPKGTAEWLKKRVISMHHHIRMDNEADFSRVARFISGREIGVVFSGGGARGFAHIGAIKAFQEEEIPIDIVGGVSMGALVGALYAMGWDNETIAKTISQNTSGMIFDITLPHSSLLSGKKLVQGLKRFFKDVQIEDLWLPFFCVSSNLTRAEPSIHRMGALWEMLQASNAAPGILPPVVLNGELHVDGGLLSNLPAPEMKGLCKGLVVGIDVTPPVDLNENTHYKNGISGWRILFSKINPFVKTISIPNIATILRRAGELASVANRKHVIENNVDLYIGLPVGKYNLQDYKLANEIIEDGYEYAKEIVKKWKSENF